MQSKPSLLKKIISHMSHPRDFKIAKQLKKCISEFFVTKADAPSVIIDDVTMIDRKNAQILYRLRHDVIETESNINEAHQKIEDSLAQTRKFIAQQLNLKAIPKLNFSIIIEDVQ